jgi:ABC-type glycerol-3-phosphate transport system substrate-binding protein
MRPSTKKLLAIALSGSLALAACGGEDDTSVAQSGDAAVEEALTELDGYQQAAGDFFEEITGGELPSDALVESLDVHVATLTTAIDALVAGDASAFTELRQAGQHMPMAALALSSAIVAATS